MRETGFVLAIAAMLVPMLQLLEQRFITPCIGVVINKGGNPLALLAAAYMLAVSLPRKVINLVDALLGREQFGTSTVAESATADAGDDAVEAELNELRSPQQSLVALLRVALLQQSAEGTASIVLLLLYSFMWWRRCMYVAIL